MTCRVECQILPAGDTCRILNVVLRRSARGPVKALLAPAQGTWCTLAVILLCESQARWTVESISRAPRPTGDTALILCRSGAVANRAIITGRAVSWWCAGHQWLIHRCCDGGRRAGASPSMHFTHTK